MSNSSLLTRIHLPVKSNEHGSINVVMGNSHTENLMTISRSLSCCVFMIFVAANENRVCFSFCGFELDETTGKLIVFCVKEASSKV
jgi:hypothetical protein